MISATEARCRACQTVVAQWMARHTDPRAITGLADRVVCGAVRLRQTIIQRTGRRPRLHALLEHAFGRDVAAVLQDIGSTSDAAAAAGTFAGLDPGLQAEVIRSIFEGLAYPPESAATIITATS